MIISFGRLLPPAGRGGRDSEGDRVIARVAWGFAAISALSSIVAAVYAPGASFIPPLLVFIFTLISINVRGGLSDLVVVEGIILTLYTLVPYFGSESADPLLRLFGRTGGDLIHDYAITGFFLGCAAGTLLFPASDKVARTISPAERLAFRAAAAIGALISLLLSIRFAQSFGFVYGGDVAYDESFDLRQTAGSGILLLSVPFAMAAFGLTLSIERRINIYCLLPMLAFAGLLIVQGQRKFLIIPFLLLGVKYFRVKGIPRILGLVVAASLIWCIFCYLGFLRTQRIDIALAFDSSVFDQFWNYASEYLGGETLTLLGTASAAYEHFVQPLPRAGDYLMAWSLAVPHPLYDSGFQTINMRFAYELDPANAELGQGWGFDFWGEAYLIGGAAFTAVMAILMTLLFRFVTLRATKAAGYGFWGVMATIGAYYALWFQRNGLAYFLKEYVIYQGIVLGALIVVASLIRIVVSGRAEGAKPLTSAAEYHAVR